MKEKLLTYLAIIICFLLVFSLVKNLLKMREIGQTITHEKASVAKLQAENERLKQEISATGSDEFIEKQLRDKLGLAKKGEIVLVMPDDDTLKKLAPQIPVEEDTLPDPNWKKWMKLFF